MLELQNLHKLGTELHGLQQLKNGLIQQTQLHENVSLLVQMVKNGMMENVKLQVLQLKVLQLQVLQFKYLLNILIIGETKKIINKRGLDIQNLSLFFKFNSTSSTL